MGGVILGQECFYRENRQDRAEEEILLTERLAEGCGETHWRIRPMTQRENEEIWKRCGLVLIDYRPVPVIHHGYFSGYLFGRWDRIYSCESFYQGFAIINISDSFVVYFNLYHIN